MRKCHHDTTYATINEDGETVHKQCLNCGEWLSLGPANDESEEVFQEMRALDWVHLAPFDLSNAIITCTCSGCHARYLANVIASHQE